MNRNTWGFDGPPPEAYSRITNPERFAPLHAAAERLIAQLESDFDVQRTEGSDLEINLDSEELARTTVRLMPGSPQAAPIQVSFTRFPGLVVHAGRWYSEPFPACGCDACAETVEAAINDFMFLIRCVTEGQFTEHLTLPPVGIAWQSTEIGDRAGGRATRGKRVTRKQARDMLGTGQPRYDWKPWPKR